MTVRRSIVGLTVLCALALSAFAAASASAGVTSFTCTETAKTRTFSDADCAVGGGSKFGHVGWGPGSTSFDAKGTITAELAGTLSGVKVKIACTGSTVTGTTTNRTTGTVMENVGSAVVIVYTGCTVTEPAGKSCVVKGGTITTNKLATIAIESPLGVKFSPESGTKFVEITIEKCTVAALNGTFPVTGTITAAASGAFLTTTTSSSGLLFGGNAATLVSKTTVTNAANNTPLTLTGGV